MFNALIGKDPKGLPYMIEEARGQALRLGNWKYITNKKKAELYNLENDPGEQTNLLAKNSEKATEMKALLERLVKGKGVRNTK
jgi:arylsulfatase A-like enzyme